MLTLTTPRLKLRAHRETDAEALFPIFASWSVIRWLAMPPWPYEKKDMETFLQTNDEVYLVMEHKGLPIGAISWRYRPASHLQSEDGPNIGYWLGEKWWGQGFMTEAAHAVCHHLFQSSDTAAIYSGYFEGNEGSSRVQAKLGFETAGKTKVMCRPHQTELPHTNTVLHRAVFGREPDL